MEEDQLKTIQDSIREYLGISEEDIKTWKEHEDAVDAAENKYDDPQSHNNIELLDASVKNTLLKLDSGIIVFETGTEMLDTVKAVTLLEEYKAAINV